MEKNYDQNKRHVLISGGSKGLGLELVRALLQEGYSVSTFSRTKTFEIEALLTLHPTAFYYASIDIQDSKALTAFVEEMHAYFKNFYALINNAAVVQEGVLATLPEVEIEKMVAINITSSLTLTRLFLRKMLTEKSGRIINISSIIGSRGYSGLSVYSATKAALDGMTRSLARELGSRSITVNSVAPGYMKSDLSASLSTEQLEKIRKRTPLGRLATTHDVTPLIRFLLSDDAAFITSQTILVDGGFQIKMPLLLPKEQLINDLQSACSNFPKAPILLHSDLLKIGLTAAPSERLQIGKDYEEALMLSLKERPLLIPTFNYDFCKNGLYNRLETPSQVGALSDHFRAQYGHLRSLTPIFNFVILNKNKEMPFTPSANVFGQDSLFAKLFEQNGLVLFLGADFSTNTFLHYIEEQAKIGYRYIKSFSGTVQDGKKSFPITVDYRVRPWYTPSIAYDFPKLQKEATAEQILKECKIGQGKLLYYHVKELFAFWTQKIAQNELYLLTSESQEQIRTFYKTKGYPLQIQMFEN